jgi:hypothetical protein
MATMLDGQVKDPDGNVIKNACAKDGMGQIPCEPAMKGSDCPMELTNPICSSIVIPGLTDNMPTYNCAQLCNP